MRESSEDSRTDNSTGSKKDSKKDRERILVSACLLGKCCKYNGGSNHNEQVIRLGEIYELIPVCPETDGGLPTPRKPSEISGGRVVNQDGDDVTAAFEAGAKLALQTARENGCRLAVFKEKSPSCGSGKIYDGTFSGTLTEGDGVAAARLKAAGIAVYGESRAAELGGRATEMLYQEGEDSLRNTGIRFQVIEEI